MTHQYLLFKEIAVTSSIKVDLLVNFTMKLENSKNIENLIKNFLSHAANYENIES